jgi:Mrp family chromosome partitioning ATPase
MGYIFDAMKMAERARKTVARTSAALSAESATPRALRLAALAASSDDLAVTAPILPDPVAESVQPPAPQRPAPDADTLAAMLKGLDSRLIAARHTHHPILEEYRGIRSQMLARWEQRRHVIHTLTSATPGEGTTVSALNLAMIFSELSDRSVILVDANLRRPAIAGKLKLPQGPGLAQVVRGESTIDQATHYFGRPNLSVLPAGDCEEGEALKLLSTHTFAGVLHALRDRYDHVIVDTPASLELSDAGLIGAQSDEVLMIVRSNHTPRSLIERAMRGLRDCNAPVASVILTAAQTPARYGYHAR